MTRLMKLVALGLGMALIAAACGSDGGSAPADDPLVQAIVDDILTEEDSLTTDRGEAECFARGLVGEIGGDRLGQLGVTVADVGDLEDFDWSEAEANVIIDKVFDCTDAAANFVSDLGGDTMTADQRACLIEVFDEDTIRNFFITSLTGGESLDIFSDLADAFSACEIDAFG